MPFLTTFFRVQFLCRLPFWQRHIVFVVSRKTWQHLKYVFYGSNVLLYFIELKSVDLTFSVCRSLSLSLSLSLSEYHSSDRSCRRGRCFYSLYFSHGVFCACARKGGNGSSFDPPINCFLALLLRMKEESRLAPCRIILMNGTSSFSKPFLSPTSLNVFRILMILKLRNGSKRLPLESQEIPGVFLRSDKNDRIYSLFVPDLDAMLIK